MEHERQQDEEERLRVQEAAKAIAEVQSNKTNICIVLGLCVVSFIISYVTNAETPMILSGSGIIIFCMIIINKIRAEGTGRNY